MKRADLWASCWFLSDVPARVRAVPVSRMAQLHLFVLASWNAIFPGETPLVK